MEESSSILGIVISGRKVGENLFETAERMLVTEAITETYGQQKKAGVLLGISPRVLNYKLGNYGLRPIDEKRRRVR